MKKNTVCVLRKDFLLILRIVCMSQHFRILIYILPEPSIIARVLTQIRMLLTCLNCEYLFLTSSQIFCGGGKTNNLLTTRNENSSVHQFQLSFQCCVHFIFSRLQHCPNCVIKQSMQYIIHKLSLLLNLLTIV